MADFLSDGGWEPKEEQPKKKPTSFMDDGWIAKDVEEPVEEPEESVKSSLPLSQLFKERAKTGLDATLGFTKEMATVQVPKLVQGLGSMIFPPPKPLEHYQDRDVFADDKAILKSIVIEPWQRQVTGQLDAGILEKTVDWMTDMAGGDPTRAEELWDEGDLGGAMAAYIGIPITGFLLGKKGTTAAKKSGVKQVGSDTLRRDSALGKLGQTGVQEITRFTGKEQAQAIKPFLQQAWKEMGRFKVEKHGNLPAWMTAKDPIAVGAKQIMAATERAVQIMNRPIKAAVKDYGWREVKDVRNAIQKDLTAFIDEKKKLSGSEGLIQQVEQIKADLSRTNTVQQLDDLRKRANAETTGLSNEAIRQIAALSKPVEGYLALGNSIRRHLYPKLEKLTQQPTGTFITIGRREVGAIQFREGVKQAYKVAEGAQNAWMEMWPWERIAESVGGSLSNRRLGMGTLQTTGVLLSPLGKFNRAFNRGLGFKQPGLLGQGTRGGMTAGMVGGVANVPDPQITVPQPPPK